MSYLSTWQSAIPEAQRRFINQLVAQLGQEQALSDQELQNAIQALVNQLAAGDTRTLCQLFMPASDELIDAEGFNLMVDGMTGDLIAAFQESMNLGRLQQTYRQLYEQRIIGELRAALDQLEANAQRLAYLNPSFSGYNRVLGSNFAQQSYCTTRTSPLADLLYRDPRVNQRLSVGFDCLVDDLAKALTLPLDTRQQHQLDAITMVSKQVAYSQDGGDLPGTTLNNLIDQQPNTYWIHQEVTNQPAPDGCNLQLELELGGTPKFSIIEIQPVANFPFSLTAVNYENMIGQTVDLLPQVSQTLQNQPISRPVRLHFDECQGRRVRLGFQQKSYQQLPAREVLLANPTGNWPYEAPLSYPGQLQDREICLYTLGFDNIMVGTALYQEMGVYVSPMLSVDKCLMVALNTEETALERRTSIEYYVVKQDFSSSQKIIQTRVVPILPLGQRQVNGEVLILNSLKGGRIFNTGTTRFCAHLNGYLCDLKIYEEDRQLKDVEYQISDDLTTQIPARLTLKNPGSNLYYTVSYSPTHLNTMSAVYLDDKPDLWYAGSNVLRCATQINGREIVSSQLYLVIIQRRNPHVAGVTPQVRQYQLLAASGV